MKALYEKQKELIEIQKQYIDWINRHEPNAPVSMRGKQMLLESIKIESELASLQGEQEREEVTFNHPQFTILGCPYTERECEECKHNIQLQKKKQPTKEEIKRQAHLFMAKDNEFLNIQNNFTVEELEATAEHLTDFGIFLIGAMEKYLQSIKPIEGEQEREDIPYTKEHLCSMALSALQALKAVYAPDEPEEHLITELSSYLKSK